MGHIQEEYCYMCIWVSQSATSLVHEYLKRGNGVIYKKNTAICVYGYLKVQVRECMSTEKAEMRSYTHILRYSGKILICSCTHVITHSYINNQFVSICLNEFNSENRTHALLLLLRLLLSLLGLLLSLLLLLLLSLLLLLLLLLLHVMVFVLA